MLPKRFQLIFSLSIYIFHTIFSLFWKYVDLQLNICLSEDISRLSPHQHVLQTSDFVDFIWNAECLSIIGTLKVDTDRSLILIDRDLVYFTTQVSDHATRIWHKWDMNDTSATRVWHECFTSDTSAARVKNFDFDNGTSENTSSQPYSNYMANERLQEEEQFHYKN